MDLREQLGALAGPETTVTDADVAADLARGRRALSRRRAAGGAGVSVFAAAAVAAVLAFNGTGASIPAAPYAAPTTSSSGTFVGANLVSYVGKQPTGYTIDKVPEGWEVQGSDDYVLTIGPKGAKDQDSYSFVGKIMVGLQSSDDHRTPTGTNVSVGGLKGVINEPQHAGPQPGPSDAPKGTVTDDSYSKNLWIQQKNGAWLQVQIWDSRGWSQADIVELGAGIHVLPGAKAAAG